MLLLSLQSREAEYFAAEGARYQRIAAATKDEVMRPIMADLAAEFARAAGQLDAIVRSRGTPSGAA